MKLSVYYNINNSAFSLGPRSRLTHHFLFFTFAATNWGKLTKLPEKKTHKFNALIFMVKLVKRRVSGENAENAL